MTNTLNRDTPVYNFTDGAFLQEVITASFERGIVGAAEFNELAWSMSFEQAAVEVEVEEAAEEVEVEEALTQDLSANEIRKAIAKAIKGCDEDEYSMEFEAVQGEGYTDVNLVIYEGEGADRELLLDLMVASVNNESEANERKAQSMASRLAKKYA